MDMHNETKLMFIDPYIGDEYLLESNIKSVRLYQFWGVFEANYFPTVDIKPRFCGLIELKVFVLRSNSMITLTFSPR